MEAGTHKTNLMSVGLMGLLLLFRLRSVLFLKPFAYPKALHETRPVLQHALLPLYACFFPRLLLGFPICLSDEE